MLYEWDMDYDGIPSNFNVNATGETASLGPFINANCDINPGSFKNHELREDSTANDLAVTPEGNLLVVYNDAKVYKYNESEYFQHFTTPVNYTVAVRGTDECVPPNVTIFATCDVIVDVCGDYLFTALVVQSTLYLPPPTPMLAKDFIDIADDGNMMLSNADGANCQNPPVGNWPTQSFNATGTPLGSAGSHCTAGPIRDVFCFRSGSGGYNLDHVTIAPYSTSQSNMYRISHSGWWWAQNYGQDVHGMGPNMLIGDYVRGAESSGVNTFWMLEGTPDFYCSEFIQDTFFYYHYNNKYFGTGAQTESDNGWNNPKDLTLDSRGNLYVLDQMNNGTGRVKGFTGSVSGGSSLGHFDVPNTISSNPLRIEGSSVSGAYGNLIFILHGDATNGYYLSVFLPGEIPW